MDYGSITNSAIPHVTSLGTTFAINYTDYKLTLVMEISFLVLVLPLLGIWIYFSAKQKKRSKKENTDELEHGDSGELAVPETRSVQIGSDDMPAPDKNKTDLQNEYELQRIHKKTDQEAKIFLNGYDKKICYLCPFLVSHVAIINSFDSEYISISTFYATVLIFALFNLKKPCKSAFFSNLYIIPSIVSFVQFFIGDHTLGEHIK